MRLQSFGEKYPFLQGNIVFWEKYLTAREETLNLLPAMIDADQLERSSFLQHMEEGKPFFAYENISLTQDNIKKLVEAFCIPLGLPIRTIDFPEHIPLLADLVLPAGEEGFLIAEIHAVIASYVEGIIAADEDAINWLENTCPICGSHAGMGLIAPSGKKNLVCSHCSAVWIYLRTACGLCGHTEERGTTFYTADEEPNWIIETCQQCGHYLKVYDMRNALPTVIAYPLFSLTSWNLDLTMREQEFEPIFFQIFERAGWITFKSGH